MRAGHRSPECRAPRGHERIRSSRPEAASVVPWSAYDGCQAGETLRLTEAPVRVQGIERRPPTPIPTVRFETPRRHPSLGSIPTRTKPSRTSIPRPHAAKPSLSLLRCRPAQRASPGPQPGGCSCPALRSQSALSSSSVRLVHNAVILWVLVFVRPDCLTKARHSVPWSPEGRPSDLARVGWGSVFGTLPSR